MLKKNEKKGLIIYLGTVFGITLLMGFLVRAAFRNNQPVSIYAGVQMLYPAYETKQHLASCHHALFKQRNGRLVYKSNSCVSDRSTNSFLAGCFCQFHHYTNINNTVFRFVSQNERKIRQIAKTMRINQNSHKIFTLFLKKFV